jgi:tetratricopeptide (TPR) repeat protein
MKTHKLTAKTTRQDNPSINMQKLLKRKGRRIWSWLLAFLSFAAPLCIALHSSTAAAAPFRLARLYSVTDGTVYLQRPNWSDFYPTYPRTMLNSDDLLDVPVGAEVILLCPDGNLRDWLGAGVNNVGSVCPGTPRRYRPSFGISDQWGAADSTKPYVISPRTGQVLNETPALYWNAVTQAQQYEVTLLRREGDRWIDVWTATSDRPSLCYPNGQPVLEPGNEYTLKVSIVGEPESTEDLPEKPVFSLVSGEEQQAVEDAIAAIEALEIDSAAKTLSLVEEVYPQSKLFAQGINDLKALINSGYETAQVYRLLGGYAVRTGLELPAEESYLEAIRLAETSNSLEEKALATWGLGTVYGRVGKTEPAKTYLQQAKHIADEIGDADLLASIEAEIARVAE